MNTPASYQPIRELLDLTDARKLVELAHEAGRMLQVGHVERFNPVGELATQTGDLLRYIHRLHDP